jgi:exodeoxyribonuclease V alpha subunit
LLYTAITRAKNLVILVGYQRVLADMVENERETLRHTGLLEKLRKGFAGIF